MAFATAQDLVKCKNYGYPNTIEGAQGYLDQKLAAALENRQGCKEDRPWHIVDFGAMLNKDEPWMGFEFETGFDDKKEYGKVVRWLWDQDYVALDKEGTGRYPIEVAFPPMELSKVHEKGTILEAMLEFIEDNNITPALNPTTFTRRDVGCHIGISTPKFRAGQRGVVGRLSNILYDLNADQMDELYGRNQLHWGTASDRRTYIELKMFKAVPHIEKVRGYIAVATRIIELTDFLIDNPKVTKIKNLYEFLSGREQIEV